MNEKTLFHIFNPDTNLKWLIQKIDEKRYTIRNFAYNEPLFVGTLFWVMKIHLKIKYILHFIFRFITKSLKIMFTRIEVIRVLQEICLKKSFIGLLNVGQTKAFQIEIKCLRKIFLT